MRELPTDLEALLARLARAGAPILALTGAGISAESGIPTFRGAEGYWTVGSRNYMPQEIATRAMFDRAPDEVWRWVLYRFGSCADARPNDGHRALAAMDRALGERFTLVTQNIDGLHLRAGSPAERTLRIHGDAALVRCAGACAGVLPIPDVARRDHEAPLSAPERGALRCARCGEWLRPHVLFFDEYYDEEHYRADSALEAATRAALLLVVGTSGATNLPMAIGEVAARRRIPIVDVNPEPNPFSRLAGPGGFALRGGAVEWLPPIALALGVRS